MNLNLNPIDYVRLDDGSIWIVGQKQAGTIFGKRVYFPDPLGERVIESGRRYTRFVSEMMPIPLDKVETVLRSREGYQRYKPHLQGVWKKYVDAMLCAGIPDEDIGIFGSQLLGFPLKKDIDFVIY